MEVNYELIKTLPDVTKAMNDLLAFREGLKTNIIDQTVTSKVTGKVGEIRDITKKQLFMNYECRGSVPISLDKYSNIIETDKTTTKYIDEYLDTYEDERKLNLLRNKLTKASK